MNRKIVKTEKSMTEKRAYICPHCEKLESFDSTMKWKEVGRYNLSENLADIVYNFDCIKCGAPLQTTIKCGKNGKEYN